jgi:hypothetical protein
MGSVNATAPARTYEIQRLSGGRWVLDSVGDDKKVAIAMANALMKSGRAALGVQVMAVQRGADGQFSEVRVYRLTPEEQQSAEAAHAKANPQQQKPKLKVERPRDEGADGGRTRLRAAPRQRAFSLKDRGMWIGIGAVLALCTVFYVWHKPQTPWAFDRPEAQTNVKQRVPMP